MTKRKEGKLPIVDTEFLWMAIGLIIVGFVVLVSASGPIAFERFGSSFFYARQQLFQGVIPGLIFMLLISRFSFKRFQKHAFKLLLVSIGLLTLVYIPGIGTDLGTFANSWIEIGGFSFQPAEVVKLTFLLYLSAWMVAERDHLHDFHEGLLPFLIVLGVVCGLIFFQPDLGTLSVIFAMSLAVFFVAGGSGLHLAGLLSASLLVFGIAIRLSPYRAARFLTFLQPDLDPQGIGYQINQALLAVGSGGLIGRGLGHSVQKYQYLPEVLGDSIFAVMAEELGFVMTAAFLVFLAVFLLRGLKIAEHAETDFGRFVGVGIITWFSVQTIVNIGAMLGVLPLTGVPLPFVSYGGTSLIISCIAIGILLNISRTANYAK
jgi:cell division protein FtsW